MRIEHLRTERLPDQHRVAAEVAWEDNERPAQLLYFAIPALYGDDLAPSPDAFLLACFPLAAWLGERRIWIEGSVCPRLRDGLRTAAAVFASWNERSRMVEIEPTDGFRPPAPCRQRRAAAFISGGIDALALLRANRLDYPVDHPGSIQDGLLLFGLNTFDFGDAGPHPERVAVFEAHVRRMQRLGEVARFTLIPVYSNARTLYPDFDTWSTVGFTAAAAAVALALKQRLSEAWLGSDGFGLQSPPLASHPLLPHHFSTAAVEIHLGQVTTTRLEKTRVVADWEEALPFVRSCLYLEIPPNDLVNCGRCEKCVRTMLGLIALGKLDQASSFPHRDVTPAMLAVVNLTPRNAPYYEECVAPLEQRGRHDLAAPLQARLVEYRRHERWKRDFASLHRFDERFLRGRLARWYGRHSV